MVLNAALPTFNFLGIFFILLPSGWHWKSRNTSTLLYIFWCVVTIIPAFVNSVIWYNTDAVFGEIWCDITTKLRIGGNVGIGAATLCITRHLEAIAAARQIHYTKEDRRRRTFIDIAIGLGLPTFVMMWHIVVQGHRFDILEGVGCTPTVYRSLPAVFLILIWPPLLFTASAVYAGLALRLFITRRYQFAKILASSTSALTPSRFLRLMALASIQIAFNLPVALYSLIVETTGQSLRPYPDWQDVHFDFGHINQISRTAWTLLDEQPRQLAELSYWTYPISCTIFFLFFGLGEESLEVYRSWWRTLCKNTLQIYRDGSKSYQASGKQIVTTEAFLAGADSAKEDPTAPSEASYGGVSVIVRHDNRSQV